MKIMLLEWLKNKPVNKLAIYIKFIPSALPFQDESNIRDELNQAGCAVRQRQQV